MLGPGAGAIAQWIRPGDLRLGMYGSWGDFLGWAPTGEADVDDPDLVNRIF